MNLLSSETSPYLRQHADNPVHWMPWGQAAFDRALRENKPVLLSIGYSACHWCHVMAHESFEDPATADAMNAHFINIKVDREERPDIDLIYQQALALMGEQGGWPLTIFLTPDLVPFWGGTYFPPEAAHGLSAFRDILGALANAWKKDNARIGLHADRLKQALADIQKTQPVTDTPTTELPVTKILSAIDPVHGGISSVQKFPMLPLIDYLWTYHIRHGHADCKTAVIDALVNMCGRGLYDHIGGGFFRYTVDAEWHMPHFEKMLNDQALFLSLLSEVAREVPHPLFISCLQETIEFLAREMRITKNGLSAFASSLDADSNGVEGGYYLMDADLLSQQLSSTDIEAIRNLYELPHIYPKRIDAKETIYRDKLKTIRAQRTPPARDNKIMIDANGRVICGLVSAFQTLRDPSILDLAISAFDYICTYAMQGGRRLSHSLLGEQVQPQSFADDYIQMGLAALALHQTTGEKRYLAAARSWADIVVTDFVDIDKGGFFMTTADNAVFGLRAKPSDDTAIASTNGSAAAFFTTLSLLSDDNTAWKETENILRLFMPDTERYPLSHGSLLTAALQAATPLTLTFHTEDRVKIENTLSGMSIPGIVLIADTEIKKGTAMICVKRTCHPPVKLDDLADALDRQRVYAGAANDF